MVSISDQTLVLFIPESEGTKITLQGNLVNIRRWKCTNIVKCFQNILLELLYVSPQRVRPIVYSMYGHGCCLASFWELWEKTQQPGNIKRLGPRGELWQQQPQTLSDASVSVSLDIDLVFPQKGIYFAGLDLISQNSRLVLWSSTLSYWMNTVPCLYWICCRC